ncbi:hypothetical protein [Patulibacter minatonensis]|uniref:hypothetical protein n=1 Tax=Patulibacter minatonensis TaxID=298163 RepID=UPI000566C33E|nr:hypothetical protein [Patulibacter minatonensis]
MATVRWTLQVRSGRFRTRTVLVDAEGADVARVEQDGRVRATRAGTAVDPSGRTWRVVGAPEDLLVTRDGERCATVDHGVLEAGGRTLGWRLPEDGSRTARVTSSAGDPSVLLRIAPGEGGSTPPWATIEFDDSLPETFGVVLAACVRLLQVDADK